MSGKNTLPSWDDFYRQVDPETMPWFYPDLDPDLADELREREISTGDFLDLGTGAGIQAIALASRGFQVTATDISAAAVEIARTRAEAAGAQVEFAQDDILNSELVPAYDFIFDRGCFHVLEPESRQIFVAKVSELLKTGGLFFLKCMSDKQPGDVGPYRISPADIHSVFAGSFDILSIRETVFQGQFKPDPHALFCVLRRKR